MRRKDREMDKIFALNVADKCEYATLAMISGDVPYCVPVSIVRIENFIYFHTAKLGHKIDCLQKSPVVCLACVGDTRRMEHDFTTEYESAIVKGIAQEVIEDGEKIQALRALCIRHTPENMDNFDAAVRQSLSRTGIWKISIEEISGKCKKC